MTVTDDLDVTIEPVNDKEHDLCSWHRVNINCSSNVPFDIFKYNITNGMSTKISNSTNKLNCSITLYASDETLISTIGFEKNLITTTLSKNLI